MWATRLHQEVGIEKVAEERGLAATADRMSHCWKIYIPQLTLFLESSIPLHFLLRKLLLSLRRALKCYALCWLSRILDICSCWWV